MYYLINPSTLFLAKNIFFHNQLINLNYDWKLVENLEPSKSVMAAWVAMRKHANQWRTNNDGSRRI